VTNVLFWNIRNFGIRKINDPRGGVVPNTGGLTYPQTSAARRAIIMAAIAAAAPDIIVIVEVGSGSTPGDLATNSGGLQGASRLLADLRALTPAAGWRMVPPLWLGARVFFARPASTETVAVLYRGITGTVNRYFTGPNLWTIGANGLSVAPAAMGALPIAGTNYPPQFDAFLTPARAIPGGSLYRPLAPERQSAARITFVRPSNKRPRGGVPYNPSRYGGFRPPYMTSFYEFDTGPMTGRTLTLFAIHSPPRTGPARSMMNDFRATPEIGNAPNAQEIKIMCGDFNLNFLNVAGAYANRYQPLTNGPLAYQSLLPTNVVPPGNPAQLQAFRGYFATHTSAVPFTGPANARVPPTAATQFLWSNPAAAPPPPPPAPGDSYYPGYGYTSAADDTDSIDNILVWPVVAQPGPNQLTVMNLVAGSPFVAQAVVPTPGVPLGAQAFPAVFGNPAPPAGWAPNPIAPNYAAPLALQLYGWPNYGRIYSTSDHFGLLAAIP
jgi:hypothetical protein